MQRDMLIGWWSHIWQFGKSSLAILPLIIREDALGQDAGGPRVTRGWFQIRYDLEIRDADGKRLPWQLNENSIDRLL